MPDLQKTIHRLKELRNWCGNQNPQTFEYEVLGDAIELLQERVHNPEGVVAEIIPISDIEQYPLVWFETPTTEYPLCVLITGVYSNGTVCLRTNSDKPEWYMNMEGVEGYLKAWRCWNIYPSYERRKEVEWLN